VTPARRYASQRLLRIVRGGQRLVAQRQVTDHGVVVVLRAVRVPVDVVLGPPATKVLVLQGELADELHELRIVRVAPGVEVQVGDLAASRGRPVDVERARRLVEEGEPGHVAVVDRQRLEVGVQGAGQVVAGQDVQAATQDERRVVGQGVQHPVQPGSHPLRDIARCLDRDGLATANRWLRSTSSKRNARATAESTASETLMLRPRSRRT